MRWNQHSQWVWSEQHTHTAIVEPETFEAAQDVFAGAQRTAVRKERTRHPYVLSGMVPARSAAARCRGRGTTTTRTTDASSRGVRITEGQHAKTVYVREDAIVPSLDEWIGSLFAEEHLDATCEALAAVSDLDPEDDPGRELDLRQQLKECDAKLARYRALLEQDSDITVVANWIAEVERERKRLERELGRKPTAASSPRPRSRHWYGSSRTSSRCWPTRTQRTSERSTTSWA